MHALQSWLARLAEVVDKMLTPYRAIQHQLEQEAREHERRSQLAWQQRVREERRAKRRALTLLLRQLDRRQRDMFRAHGYFYVTGGGSGVTYRIRCAKIGNIDVLTPDGNVAHHLCAHPAGDLPVYDFLVGQMLQLQDATTERSFLRKANIIPLDLKILLTSM